MSDKYYLGCQVYSDQLSDALPRLDSFIRELDANELAKLPLSNHTIALGQLGIYHSLSNNQHYVLYRRNDKLFITPLPTCIRVHPSQVDYLTKNKTNLKKLILLTLRHSGITSKHPEFRLIWKQLYCGCLFALRKDLNITEISNESFLQVINNNFKAFSIK